MLLFEFGMMQTASDLQAASLGPVSAWVPASALDIHV